MALTENIKHLVSINQKNFLEQCHHNYAWQLQHIPIYALYNNAIKKDKVINSCKDFIFLPISFFKTHAVYNQQVITPSNIGNYTCFESSGTTASVSSKHVLQSTELYTLSFINHFQQFFGSIAQYCILGLLPSYIQKGNSSLVYMVDHLIKESKHPLSDFYLYNYPNFINTLEILEMQKQKTIVFGVTFALLDVAEKYKIKASNTTIIETGGMKGRRKEITREELHNTLTESFEGATISSEYGMTELLSQAYRKENGRYYCPAWMKVLVRDINDPLDIKESGKGAINIIDLANIYSCSFIATDDIGEVYEDGGFTILGRLDNADTRGCSLLTI